MVNKHESYELAQYQSLPLESKVRMTQQRIRAWYEYWDGQVYVSFSGGKDSTVLKHIVDSMYDDVPAVFVNTGLEYPEIQSFVRDVKAGKYECFNSDVEMLRPEMRFDEVIKTYGYPVVSKEVSQIIEEARNSRSETKTYKKRIKQLNGELVDPNGNKSRYNCEKWKFLYESNIPISNKCCSVMKKKPSKMYEKQTGRKCMVGTMAEESAARKTSWLRYGCNSFGGEGKEKRPMGKPMSFWTEQDVFEYIVKYEVPYASVYGQIQEEGELEGQMYIDGFHTKLCTSGVDRTGCMFCMFGCHLDKLGKDRDKNRFQVMKETHPKQYAYCMKSVEDGGLGIKEVLDFINVPYE